MPRSVCVSLLLLPYFSSFRNEFISYWYSRDEALLPTICSIFTSENCSFFLVEYQLAAGQMQGNAVLGPGALHRHIALPNIFHDFIHRAFEGIAQPAAARPLDADGIISLQPVVAEARREMLCIFCLWIDHACALAAGQTVITPERLDGLLVGAHGKTDFVGENAIIAGEAQTAAPFTGAAGI